MKKERNRERKRIFFWANLRDEMAGDTPSSALRTLDNRDAAAVSWGNFPATERLIARAFLQDGEPKFVNERLDAAKMQCSQ